MGSLRSPVSAALARLRLEPGGFFGSSHYAIRHGRDSAKAMNGGEGGIRTLGTRKGTTVFETAPFDRSGTSPQDKRAGA